MEDEIAGGTLERLRRLGNSRWRRGKLRGKLEESMQVTMTDEVPLCSHEIGQLAD